MHRVLFSVETFSRLRDRHQGSKIRQDPPSYLTCSLFCFHCDTNNTRTTMLAPRIARSASRLVVTATRRSYAASTTLSAKAAFPAPRLFDYDTVTSNLSVVDAIDSVEAAFGALAQGNVDVPMPMHIGIHETATAGPGDCHISTSSFL